MEEAKSKNIDAIVVDTAGRLQVNLHYILISVTSVNLWNSTLSLIYPYLYTKLIIHMSYKLESLTPADDLSAIQIDKSMMDELKEVKKAVNPTEVLLVVDAMTGQEAAGIHLFLLSIVAAWVMPRAKI
jgi:hypothetical protein